MEFVVQKMGHANNEKRKTTNNGRNRATRSTKNQNARRKGNLQILEKFRIGHHRTSGDKRKKILKSVSGERENYSKPNYMAEISSKGWISGLSFS